MSLAYTFVKSHNFDIIWEDYIRPRKDAFWNQQPIPYICSQRVQESGEGEPMAPY